MNRCPAGHAFWDDELSGLCPLCLIGLSSPPLGDIGPYRRIKKVGEGGFGCVYLARRGSEPPVALKVMRNPHFSDPSAAERFRKETKIHSRLDRDCFVRIGDVGEHEGCPYFTMEYMEGGTLRERMAAVRGSPEHAAELMIEIANAVELLHSDPEDPGREPILHCDLKPENILFDAAGRPRLSDFGIAKLAGAESWTGTTRGFGSPWYMAPEQAHSAAHTPAADVYSLGAILYELLTGQPPFEGTESQVLRKLAATGEQPAPPRQLAPHVDRHLELVVLNALEKDPVRRYPSAAAFAADLRRAIERRPPEYVRGRGLAARVPSVLRGGARRWVLLAGLGLVVGSVLAARTGRERRQPARGERASVAREGG